LNIGNTTIQDTFAEAFTMYFARIIVTAYNQSWLETAVAAFTGYGTSIIGCDAEVGLESYVGNSQTLDGRAGASLLVFGFSAKAVEKALCNRTAQCLMTCPTTAVFDGGWADRPVGGNEDSPAAPNSDVDAQSDSQGAYPTNRISLGDHLRFFGDGFQKSKLIGERRFWRVPVMDGEFIVEDCVGVSKGVAGGNFLVLATDQIVGLTAAQRAVDRIAALDRVITPFPGGVDPKLRASTSHQFCPTLRGQVESKLPPEIGCVYEIVIDGTDFNSVAEATKQGIQAAVAEGIVAISAGNYGGELGKHHFHLRELFADKS